ncbi:hypothetical protein PIB30_108851, partial [Stylosanthes scabra]|nr:hypothetical protein [Stylosanthes scabra]
AYNILNNMSIRFRGRGNLTLSIGHDVLKVGMLHRARQARRRAELERLASDNNHFDWSNSDSDSDTRTTSSDTGTFTMGERLTLKQIGDEFHGNSDARLDHGYERIGSCYS